MLSAYDVRVKFVGEAIKIGSNINTDELDSSKYYLFDWGKGGAMVESLVPSIELLKEVIMRKDQLCNQFIC